MEGGIPTETRTGSYKVGLLQSVFARASFSFYKIELRFNK
jgi:hypothetical protein